MSNSLLKLEPTINCGIPQVNDGSGKCGNCVACQISICSHVDPKGLARMREMSQSTAFAKGETLFRQGDVLEKTWIISDGIIKLSHLLPDGQYQVTGFLGPGDILGGIRRKDNAHATAESLTAGEACMFTRDRFFELVTDYPDLCVNLLVAATDEIEALNDHIVLLGRKRAPERLAAFLLMLSHRWNLSDGSRSIVQLPMSRSDIADHLGLSVETVSRTFAQFRAARYISTSNPKLVKLANLAALYQLAGFEEVPARRVALGM